MDYCGPGRCGRCPAEVRLDNLGGLVGSWMPPAQRYPVAGSERLSLDSIPYDDPHEVDRQSGAWGSRMPLGAGGGQGSGEGKYRIDTRLAFPSGRQAPRSRHPGAPEQCSICFDDAKVLTSAECGEYLYCELCLASHIAVQVTELESQQALRDLPLPGLRGFCVSHRGRRAGPRQHPHGRRPSLRAGPGDGREVPIMQEDLLHDLLRACAPQEHVRGG
mmetsp:Transcript_118818/g.380630  ORF Transcript_118818/g.380630 Transcript_118818/m.380630 type:complete len:218 (-) Transcript_118818:377-1030(-)